MNPGSNPNSVRYKQSETDARIYNRNIPSKMLQPNLPSRPTATKYSLLPVAAPSVRATVPALTYPTYDISTTFNPGTAKAPWSGMASNINVESELRNQIHPLQKCSTTEYVPDSQSDLYAYAFSPSGSTTGSVNVSAAHSLLFTPQSFLGSGTAGPLLDDNNSNSNSTSNGGMFNNSTRTSSEMPVYK